jgi:signal transduction histidine kinase
MIANPEGLFDVDVWRPALENYGAVTGLTVAVYDRHARAIFRPLPSTPLCAFFERHRHEPGILSECVRLGLRPEGSQPPVIVCQSYGLAAVGVSLVLDGEIVGAAVAGYALIEFCQSSALASMAHKTGLPFRQLWTVAIQVQPIPERRLITHGELLKVLGDTILREHDRTLKLQGVAGELERRVRERTFELASANRSLGVEVRERREAEARVRKLLARVVVAQQEERYRVARDIHDHLGQEMIAIKLRLERLQMELDAKSDPHKGSVDDVLMLLARLDADVELLTAGLRPLLLENLGLMKALAAFVDDWSRHSGVAAQFRDLRRDRVSLEPDAETHVFRIAQEALSNIHKHAEARNVDVRLQRCDEMIVLEIEDDGKGFDSSARTDVDEPHGMGLVGMHERASLMRGTFSINSMPGKGTTVVVSIPMQ